MVSSNSSPPLRRDRGLIGPFDLRKNRPSRDGFPKSGGETRNRTRDTRIFSALLYQLSYLAVREGRRISRFICVNRFLSSGLTTTVDYS
jgi:hypothetical protein